MQKLYIKTHGCQMNEYDSAQMANLLSATHGITQTNDPSEADILLLNTCSIREKAQEKVFSELGRWRELKEKNPALILGVGGCVASQEGNAIRARAPYVDLIFGPQTLHRLPQMLKALREKRTPQIDISFPEIEKFDCLPEPRAQGPSAYVSIMEGCSKYCSFCIVPYTRGEEISRPFDDIIAEVVGLSAQNVKEINLLGQNVNGYLGKMHDGEIADLALLIRYIAAIDGIERIRFTTSHPAVFGDRLIEAYAEVPELAAHLHLPVQSGSDRILMGMKRGYTALEYKSKMRKLKKACPGICLSTDIIVGFPGETDEDFAATMDLVGEMGFDTSFSFIYSKRPGTPASNLPDDVSEETKKQRLKLLQGRIVQQAQAISEAMVGSTQRVLVTGRSKKSPDDLQARTESNRVVNFRGDAALIGEFATVSILSAHPNSLRGELCLASSTIPA